MPLPQCHSLSVALENPDWFTVYLLSFDVLLLNNDEN